MDGEDFLINGVEVLSNVSNVPEEYSKELEKFYEYGEIPEDPPEVSFLSEGSSLVLAVYSFFN